VLALVPLFSNAPLFQRNLEFFGGDFASDLLLILRDLRAQSFRQIGRRFAELLVLRVVLSERGLLCGLRCGFSTNRSPDIFKTLSAAVRGLVKR